VKPILNRRGKGIPSLGVPIGGILAFMWTFAPPVSPTDVSWGIVYAAETEDQALIVAAQKGNADGVKRLLAGGANIETIDGYGRPLLDVATAFGQTEIVQILLTAGAKANAVTGNRQTALHIAAAYGKTDIVKALLTAGAGVNVADHDGNSPLHIAVTNPTSRLVVKELLDAGAKVDAVNNDGLQPIHLATQSAQADTVQILLTAGAKSDAVDLHGLRPLHFAAQGGAHRINVSRTFGNKGHNLTKLLYGLEYTTVAKVLLSNGASLDVEDTSGKRPIDYASENGFSEMVEALIAEGAKPPRETRSVIRLSRPESH
jgi:ankyrin repeat protein